MSHIARRRFLAIAAAGLVARVAHAEENPYNNLRRPRPVAAVIYDVTTDTEISERVEQILKTIVSPTIGEPQENQKEVATIVAREMRRYGVGPVLGMLAHMENYQREIFVHPDFPNYVGIVENGVGLILHYMLITNPQKTADGPFFGPIVKDFNTENYAARKAFSDVNPGKVFTPKQNLQAKQNYIKAFEAKGDKLPSYISVPMDQLSNLQEFLARPAAPTPTAKPPAHSR